MVICINKKGAEDYAEYAESIVKERLRNSNFRIMNPEMFEKVKKDRLLFEAIRNANASAMARVGTEYGADILIRVFIAVESTEKFTSSWEGMASVSLIAIDTKTAEEIETLFNDPMGSVENPAPVEDSSLASKQMAIRHAIDNLFLKMGVSLEVSSPITSISPKFYTVFSGEDDAVRYMTFSPDGLVLVIATGVKLHIWNVSEKRQIAELKSDHGNIYHMVFDRGGRYIAAATSGGNIYIWQWPDRRARVIDAHSKGTWAVDINPDTSMIASGGGDGVIRLWDMTTLTKIGELYGHAKKINSLFFDVQGRHVITASDDLTIRQWDVNTKKEVRAFAEPMDRLSTAVLSHDRGLIGYAAKTIEIDLGRNRRTDKRYIRLRDMVSGRDISTFEGHSKDITAVAFFPGKRFMVSAAEDKTVKIWDTQKRGEVTTLEQNDVATSVAVSRDGKWLAIGGREGKVAIWNLR